MKTPREILLRRHQAAEPKLDQIRERVLAKGLPRSTMARQENLLSTFQAQLSTLLWPNPRAWAGLAGVWAVIFVLHFASDGESKAVAATEPARSPEVLAILQEQRRLLAELSGRAETSDSGRRNPSLLPPRSERREWYAV